VDARVPAVETTALLATRSVGVSPAAIEASRLGGWIRHEGEIAVKIHGDVAIVTSQITLAGRYNGKEVSGEFRSTHIWKNDKGHWQLLMNQLTAIAKD